MPVYAIEEDGNGISTVGSAESALKVEKLVLGTTSYDISEYTEDETGSSFLSYNDACINAMEETYSGEYVEKAFDTMPTMDDSYINRAIYKINSIREVLLAGRGSSDEKILVYSQN